MNELSGRLTLDWVDFVMVSVVSIGKSKAKFGCNRLIYTLTISKDPRWGE